MSYNEIVGTTGVGLILLAYFANVFSLIPREGKLFFFLNVIGSALACYASWLIHFWPFVILEGAWCVVSIIGLIKVYQK